MASLIGNLELPRVSPNFLELRKAVRPYLKEHVHIGLSGGPDSLALVAAVLAEKSQVTAICIDHNLQTGSAEVTHNAAAMARHMGAQAIVKSIEVAPGRGWRPPPGRLGTRLLRSSPMRFGWRTPWMIKPRPISLAVCGGIPRA